MRNMKNIILEVKQNQKIADGIYKMILAGDVGKLVSGQFMEISLDGFYLRRPFSLADFDNHCVTILYKVLGNGTEYMTTLKIGAKLDCLTELGNGFNLDKSQKPLLVGGGIGIAPLYKLAKDFVQRGITPIIALGYKNKAEAFYIDEFKALGEVIVSTDDGSVGYCGNIVEAIKAEQNLDYDFLYACGPMIMLSSVAKLKTEGELSLEARMACGFGACMGCSINTANGVKRVCKDGPVFKSSEVIF